MGRNDKQNHWHITHYHPQNLNNHVTTSNTFFLHLLAPLSAFPLQSIPPKTQASQRNKAQAEHLPAASTQLVAITADASELQVMIETNKPTTKCTHANDTTSTDTDAVPVKKKAKATPPQHDTAPEAKVNPAPKPHKTKATSLPHDMAGPEVRVNLIDKGSEILQGWKGCNNHPGLVDQKRAKHTSVQVKADKEAKVEAKR
jgi:hypothetical protein